MSSIGVISLKIPVWSPTLLNLDCPLTALIGITRKEK
jgi:hypothetical protein